MTGTFSERRASALFTLLLASTLGVMAGATVAPVLAVIQNDLGVSGTAAGFIITTHGLTIAVASPLVGRMIDRYGVRVPLAVGLVLYGLGGGAGIFVDGYPLLIASRAVLGLGAAIVFTGTTVALLALYAPGPERDRMMGWRTTAITVGGLLWPLLAGALGEISWHVSFSVYLVGIPLGLAVLATVPSTTSPGGTTTGGAFRTLVSHPRLIGILAIILASGLMLYVPAVFLPKRLEQIGITSTFVTAIYAVTLGAVAASVLGLFYDRIRARLDDAWIMRIASAGWTVGLLAYAFIDHPVPLLLAPVLLGAGNGLAMSTLTLLVAEQVPADQRGRATSLQGTAMFAGQFLSPLFAGPLIAATTYATGFTAAAGLAALITILVTVTRVAHLPDRADDDASALAR
ncbi:MFS transporter [Nocardioides sp. NPDC006273]|uniref:MFS transporter n=1 Tax=Nocardioides sp. NPDC006273 TaxID=3155598 RepID=UPI0033A2BA41